MDSKNRNKMKQTIRFIAIIVLSAVVAFAMACIVLAITDSAKAFAFTYFIGAFFIALAIGAFDMKERTRYDSIKHRDGRSYGQAAIFLGTACLYIGTPKECEELADDLWHRGQQVEVSELTDSETFDIL